MKVKICLFAVLSIMSISLMAQNIDDDPEFGAIKAEFLMKKGRFEDAIKVLNDVLKKDGNNPTYLLIRAEAKYALGAYKGAKKDAMAYLDVAGINEKLCYIMGKTEMALGNPQAAIGYMEAAVHWNDQEANYFLERGNIYWELEEEELACGDWHKALRMGSDYAAHQARKYCPRVRVPIEDKKKPTNTRDEDENNDSGSDDENTEPTDNDKQIPPYENQGENNSDEDPSNDDNGNTDEVEDEDRPEPIDDSVNRIYIDEDLTLEIRDGLGSRETRELPDMLILSDNSGLVVVDVCVDKYGEVMDAKVNRTKSTIYTVSLVNLALRKSKEIYFERSWKKEQCGSIYFSIKGSK